MAAANGSKANEQGTIDGMDVATFEDLLHNLDELTPTVRSLRVPDALVEQSLQRSGVGDPDARTTRLIGLAAHKLVVDMASTAYERSSQRARSTAKTRREHGVEALAQRHVLTSDDVVSAAEAAGVPMRQRTHFPSSTSPDTG